MALWGGCVTVEMGGSPLEITYIANEGFLVRSGSRKVLIDALFCDVTIDIAFLEFFDCSSDTGEILVKRVRPRQIVFMHLPRDRVLRGRIRADLEQDFPAAVLFEEPLESRSF